MIERPGDLARDVLHQRAAHRDIEHLHASADRQEGDTAGHRGARKRDLEVVAAILGRLERGVRHFAVKRRIDVAAPGQHQSVDAREDLLGRFRAGHHLDGLAARAANGLHVVVHATVLRDRNQRHVSASYIRAGTATPITSSARVNCWR